MDFKSNERVLLKIHTETGVDTVEFDNLSKAQEAVGGINLRERDDFIYIGNVFVKVGSISKFVFEKKEKMFEATFRLDSGIYQPRHTIYFKSESDMRDFERSLKRDGSYKNATFFINKKITG